MEDIQAKMVPETVLSNVSASKGLGSSSMLTMWQYMIQAMTSSESLWLMRKQFATQTATMMFLTYFCCLSSRTPSRFHFSRKTGLMYMTEILPGESMSSALLAGHTDPASAFASGQPIIASSEHVPFRLTPNMQHFITRVGIEGVVTSCVTAIAKSLTVPEFDLGGTLSLFVRDEVSHS
jgi:transformation/transcription domain-associated protein